MNTHKRIQTLSIAALLIAVGTVIPLFMPKIIIGPCSLSESVQFHKTSENIFPFILRDSAARILYIEPQRIIIPQFIAK